MPNDDLGPLPKADDRITGENESRAALRSAIDHSRFRIRDEHESDAGVDATLEILLDGSYTNFRAQLQLKSTASEIANHDGSVSYQIEVKNLNYLLNGTSPIYVLYVRPRRELRFAWAHDERSRLNVENPSWSEQSTVTVRFDRLLDEAALGEIHDRLIREGLLRSDIARRLGDRSASEFLTLHIDAESINVINSATAESVLLDNGLSIVTAGYPDYVLQALEILPRERRSNGRLSLVRAYAEFALGRLAAASAAMQDAEVRIDEIGEEDRRFLEQLRNACDFQSGEITVEGFAERERARAESSKGDPVSRFFVLREQALHDTEISSRTDLTNDAMELGSAILLDAGISEAVKLTVGLHLTYLEAPLELSRVLSEVANVAIQREIGFRIDVVELIRVGTELGRSATRFDARGEAHIAEATAIGHPLLFADAVVQQAALRSLFLASQFQVIGLLGLESFVSMSDITAAISAASDETIVRLEKAKETFDVARRLDGSLRAQLAIGEHLALQGRTDEAREVGRKVLPAARAIRAHNLISLAEQLEAGDSVIARLASGLRPGRPERT